MTVRAPTVHLPKSEPRIEIRLTDDRGRLTDHGEIGRGGMGVVHRVRDEHIERYAALKRPHDHLRDSVEAMRSFVREAQVLGQLDHPNVVPLYDLSVDDDGKPVHFMMKLVHGDTLHHRVVSQKVDERSEEELRDLLQVLCKVCDAIAFAHGQGILHRDLKPENVMIGSHGQVYVMDWGIAGLGERPPGSSPSRSGDASEIGGTPQYMAPEQAWGDRAKISERTDVFALGAILYFILTGKAPNRAPSSREAWERARACDIKPPAELVPDAVVPPRLAQIAMHALARDPNDRHPSVEAFKGEIERFLRSGLWYAARSFPAGTLILREGDEGELAFIIVRGQCEVFRGDQVLRTMGPGDVFGEMAILTDGKRTASVRAIDDVEAMVVSRESLLRELGEDSWLGALVRALAARFRELEQRLHEK